jgi:hypothetical protein
MVHDDRELYLRVEHIERASLIELHPAHEEQDRPSPRRSTRRPRARGQGLRCRERRADRGGPGSGLLSGLSRDARPSRVLQFGYVRLGPLAPVRADLAQAQGKDRLA